jgi:hypothetical protein
MRLSPVPLVLLVLLPLLTACAGARAARTTAPQAPPGEAALRWVLSEAYDGSWDLRITTIAGAEFDGRVREFYPNGILLGDRLLALDDIDTVVRRGQRGFVLDLAIIFGGLGGAAAYVMTSGAAGSTGACVSPCREQRIATYTVIGAVFGAVMGAILNPGTDDAVLWSRG